MKGRDEVGTRISIDDVAALAGVSTATVSNVLNHPERVRPTTAAKVTRAIEILDYRPNANARSLAAGKSRTIGLVLPDLGNSFFIELARGAESAAERAGYVLMIANGDGNADRERRYLTAFAEQRAAGVLLAARHEQHFAEMAHLGRDVPPTVLVNSEVPADRGCSVSTDHALGAYLLTQHLADLGRKKIALVFSADPFARRPLRSRAEGFDRALQVLGVEWVRSIVTPHPSRADGWHAGRELVDDVRAGRIDAIATGTDLLAAGVVQALTGAPGLRVPQDAAVTGYDNNSAAWDSPVPLTTIEPPGFEIGTTAVAALLDEITDGDGHVHRAEVMEPTLVVRASTVPERPPSPEPVA